MMKFIKKNKKGFTLVELIVVIAILGILAAVVVPRVGEFRNQANISHDRSTLRTVQGAINMYHAQHGRWPGQAVPPATGYATGFVAGPLLANYTALATPLAPFLDLQDGPDTGTDPDMPIARSSDGVTLREFQYDPDSGLVSITPPLPAN